MAIERFRYDGKRALIVGAATGMGAATARAVTELGGEVIALDVAPISYPAKQVVTANLSQRASVDAALAQIGGPIHAVFLCAGVADGNPHILAINFLAQRHLLEKLVERSALPRGSAVALISSVAGMGWQMNLAKLKEFMALPDWDSAAAWSAANEGTNSYVFSKQAMNFYAAQQAFPLSKRGIRINAIEPGPTDTPLARANADVWLRFGKTYREEAGVETLTPEQMADVLVFLCSPAASGMSGISMLIDQGLMNSGIAGSFTKPPM
ncbi:MAG: SDR family oxidoreductase [Deltaproteobacteria bacterium]|nr:SDR family oxidoreductase [Deltaproteobacteria bacterium]